MPESVLVTMPPIDTNINVAIKVRIERKCKSL
jgi:hypothetical protein